MKGLRSSTEDFTLVTPRASSKPVDKEKVDYDARLRIVEKGKDLQAKGRYREAESCYMQSLQLALELHGENSFQAAESLGYIGNVLDVLGNHQQAQAALNKALQLKKVLYQEFITENPNKVSLKIHMGMVKALTDLANHHRGRGAMDAAKPLLWKALEICNGNQPEQRDVLHDDHLSRVLAQLIALAELAGQHEEAYRFCYVQHAIMDTSADLTLAGKANGALGVLLDKRGEFAKSEPLLKRSLYLHEKVGTNNSCLADALSNMATHYLCRGRLREAEPLFVQAIQVVEDALAPDHTLFGTLQNLARLYICQKRYTLAQANLERAARIGRRAFGENHPNNASTHYTLAEVHFLKHDARQAVRHMQIAIKLYEQAYGGRNDTCREWKRQLVSYQRARHEQAAIEDSFAMVIYDAEAADEHLAEKAEEEGGKAGASGGASGGGILDQFLPAFMCSADQCSSRKAIEQGNSGQPVEEDDGIFSKIKNTIVSALS